MADPELYSKETELKQVQDEHQEVHRKLDDLNKKWEELVDEISTLQEAIA